MFHVVVLLERDPHPILKSIVATNRLSSLVAVCLSLLILTSALTTFVVLPTEESTGGQHDAASMFYVEGSVFRGMCCVYFLPLMFFFCLFFYFFLVNQNVCCFFFSDQTRAPSKFIAFSKGFFLSLFRKGQIYRVHKLLSTATIWEASL